MFYKYLKLIAVSTLLLQAAPIAFDSLGNELEEFNGDCQAFERIAGISHEVQSACMTYQRQLTEAFKTGYRLDPEIEAEKINEKELQRYLSKLRLLDKQKEHILELLYVEARKARKENNFDYYGALISNYKVRLYDSDYVFLGKHKNIFKNNIRYLTNFDYIFDLEEERLKKERAKQAQYKTRTQKKILQSGLSVSSMDQVSPKAYHSFGNELEEFKEDCEAFQKITGISEQIQNGCKKYQLQLTKAFEIGYRLDPSVEQENVDKKELQRYLSKLRLLDQRKENILRQLYLEARKARANNNFSYYGALTENYKVRLYNSDYQYMEKYKILFHNNARYLAHNKHLQYLEEERLKNEREKRYQDNRNNMRDRYYRVNY